jgi:hypothetical protein
VYDQNDRIVHFSNKQKDAIQFCKAHGIGEENIKQAFIKSPFTESSEELTHGGSGIYEPNDQGLLVQITEEENVRS